MSNPSLEQEKSVAAAQHVRKTKTNFALTKADGCIGFMVVLYGYTGGCESVTKNLLFFHPSNQDNGGSYHLASLSMVVRLYLSSDERVENLDIVDRGFGSVLSESTRTVDLFEHVFESRNPDACPNSPCF